MTKKFRKYKRNKINWNNDIVLFTRLKTLNEMINKKFEELKKLIIMYDKESDAIAIINNGNTKREKKEGS